MKVEVRSRELENALNGLKGTASISFDGCFAVHNVSIVENKDGNLFVSMPSYKTRQLDENGKDIYKDICFPVTKEFRERLNNAVLTSFKEHKPVMIDTARGRDQVMSDAVKAAMEDMGELPFEGGAILRSRIQDGSDEMPQSECEGATPQNKGESVKADSPEVKGSVKDGLAGKIKEAKDKAHSAVGRSSKNIASQTI